MFCILQLPKHFLHNVIFWISEQCQEVNGAGIITILQMRKPSHVKTATNGQTDQGGHIPACNW